MNCDVYVFISLWSSDTELSELDDLDILSFLCFLCFLCLDLPVLWCDMCLREVSKSESDVSEHESEVSESLDEELSYLDFLCFPPMFLSELTWQKFENIKSVRFSKSNPILVQLCL